MSALQLPQGFVWSAGIAGLKASGKPDLAIALVPGGANAAAVFTTNRVAAAPVLIGKEHLKRSRGRVSALVVNAGNANCATGVHGERATKAVCKALSRLIDLPEQQVFPSSTGIIGVPLPFERIVHALPAILKAGSAKDSSFRAFSAAIMTTDKRPKIASSIISFGGRRVRVAAAAKGSGMIHPNMATMLAYIFTDAVATPALLSRALKRSVDQSFNRISVDGDTSTNDTVLLLASGASGVVLDATNLGRFQSALDRVCLDLARQIVADGEGVQHVVTLHIEAARNEKDALSAAAAVANSPLVKTALAGGDPNWGRILAAIGYSGVRIDPGKLNIYIGETQVCRGGASITFDRAAARRTMLRPDYDIRIQLGMGKAELRYLACDLSQEYVAINSEYST